MNTNAMFIDDTIKYWNNVFLNEINNKLKLVDNHNVFMTCQGFKDKGDFQKSINDGVPLLSTNGFFGVTANSVDNGSVPVKHGSEMLCIGFQQHFAGISSYILSNINKIPTIIGIEIFGDDKEKSVLTFSAKGCIVLKSISIQSGKYEQYTGLLFLNCKEVKDQTMGKGVIVATSETV